MLERCLSAMRMPSGLAATTTFLSPMHRMGIDAVLTAWTFEQVSSRVTRPMASSGMTPARVFHVPMSSHVPL